MKTSYNEEGRIMGNVAEMNILDDPSSINVFSNNIKILCSEYKIHPQDIMILSSPLLRCVQTAEILRDAIKSKADLKILDDLEETNMGEFTDKKASVLREEYGDYLIDTWMHNPMRFAFPGGESYKHVQKRVRNIMEMISNIDLKKKTIFVCSHVDIIKMFICEVEGKSFNNRREFDVPNASISLLSLDKDSNFKVKKVNLFA